MYPQADVPVVLLSLFTAGLKLRLPLKNRSWRVAYGLAGPVMILTIAGLVAFNDSPTALGSFRGSVGGFARLADQLIHRHGAVAEGAKKPPRKRCEVVVFKRQGKTVRRCRLPKRRPAANSLALHTSTRARSSTRGIISSMRTKALARRPAIPCAVLKGPVLAALVYPHPATRTMMDIDILVPEDRLDAAVAVL